jgi:penicillin-binding protein 1A
MENTSTDNSGKWRGRIVRLIKWSAILTLISTIIVGCVGGYLYYQHVVSEPGLHLSKTSILRSMEKESPIYYRDGKTQINVLFEERHRIYVPYNELPESWVQAITAAEDQRYFTHWGLDPISITRAVVQNVKAQRIVSGASTLTQQTAKNLFNRPDRSLRSKAEEAVNALRLEAHYSKEEILEFYANQFHVTGNGRGIGIAAKYYFDKSVPELGIIETAFIAGMVKGPSRYDPFFGSDEVRRKKNIERAQARVQYVLSRMLEVGHLTQQQYESLKDEPIPFKHGTFQYGKSSIVDEVVQRLEHEPFPALFEEYNIDNPSTAGLKIITTIDEDIQRHAQYGLVHHLSDVGGILDGIDSDNYLFPTNKVRQDALAKKYEKGDLFYASVTEKREAELVVKDGNGMCIVDENALRRSAKIIAKSKDSPSRKYSSSDLLQTISIGDVLWVSYREKGSCDIEFSVELQGAVIALHKGEILSMVGGTNNSDFNRATDAQRQFGSTWKSLIYTAALQLGWSPLDILDNRANAFPFERVWYYPRSGHSNTPDFVSLSWTGVKSENRASVWLLYHLTDRLMIKDYNSLIEQVGLSQFASENRDKYIKRIRDDYGVISTSEMLDEIAFNAAKRVVILDMEEDEEAVRLRSLLYGTGAKKARKRLRSRTLKDVVSYNYTSLRPVIETCDRQWGMALNFNVIEGAEIPEIPSLWFDNKSNRFGCGSKSPSAVSVSLENLQLISEETQLWVNDHFRLSILQSLESKREIKMVLMADLDPYSVDFLMHHSDFIQLVNMRYINLLSKSIGLEKTLPLTLTIPLGAVDISLLDAAMMYNGILTGSRYSLKQNQQKGNILVKKIIGPQGEVLYEAEPEKKQVSNFVSGLLVSDILQNVVEHGTGRRANKYKTSNKTLVPLIGKTGTTNSFKNAAFIGLVPKAYGGSWSIADGVVLATYVGFDEPRPMKYGKTKLSGASGALPVWLQTVEGVEKSGYMGRPNPELTWEAPIQDGLFSVSVDTRIGFPDSTAKGRVWIYDPQNLWGQEPVHNRAFSPVNVDQAPLWNPLISTGDKENEEIQNIRLIPQENEVDEKEINPRIQRERFVE